MSTVVDRNHEDFQLVTDDYARRSLASMRDDLDALRHAQTCKRDGCKRGSETKRFKKADGSYGSQMIHERPETWHDEEAADQHIQESHYGIQVRSDWHTPGEESEATEYLITLGGGGPASRIAGELESGEPYTARFEYQDWFKPWTAAHLNDEETATLLEWAQRLYFGE